MLTLLTTRQQFVIDKMATMIMRESSDMKDSSEEDLDLGVENIVDALGHGKSSVRSSNKVDQRLVNFYRLKRWSEDSKKREA